MWRKKIARVVAFCVATVMLCSISYAADGAVNGSEIIHGVNTDYSEQQIKTVFAFYTNDRNAVVPSTVGDIVLAVQSDILAESYTIELAENAKDYIVILFGGSGKQVNRSVIELEHTTHIWETEWSKDETGHWYGCTRVDCTAKNGFDVHTPFSDSSNCSATVSCSECGFVITPAADGHIYTDITDSSCTFSLLDLRSTISLRNFGFF